MTLLTSTQATSVLVDAASRTPTDQRARARLDDVLALFHADVRQIEHGLAEACRSGEAPATDAAAHLVTAGGKRVRPLMVLLASRCFGREPEAQAREIAIVAEMVHSATLLHDDVIDDADERRARPTARKLWTNAVSVLAGDLLLTHALDRTLAAAPATLPDLLRTLRRLVDGEVIQLRGRSQLDASQDVYFRILEDKTASLFGWAARAGAAVGGADEAQRAAIGVFGERLGVAFQLVDDALDYAGDPAATGKTLFADLAEGKLTLPLVLALAERPALRDDLEAARGGDHGAAIRLGVQVRALGACEEVRLRAADETDRAVAALAKLPASPFRDMLVDVAAALVGRGR